ncbi:hypothetical protein [Olivibacter domesticus]|uniref:Secreted protein n=1 Tax=Olivibacter domesticus TaxID=407022 RepID=A0A1H7KIJ4_OLID1|nr:hypothetical protein [Olivibacter domesticus]SEK86608.1 hypothetical protein SAMN05661044_01366 [Olivibacter domesticus]
MNVKKITGTVLVAAMLSGGGIALAKAKATKAEMAARQDQEWAYTPDPEDANPDPTQASNYTQVGSLNCPGGDELCGITAPAAGSQPDLDKDPNFRTRIQSLDQTQGDVHSFN